MAISNKNLEPLLSNTVLFSGLDKNFILDIISESTQVHFKKGQELFSTGDNAKNFFFLIKGLVKLYRLNKDGDETIIHVIPPFEIFAEAAVFSPKQLYPLSAEAIEESTLLSIPRKAFVDRFTKDPEIALHILSSISAHQKYLINKIEQMVVKSAPQRIGIFLLKLCKKNTAGSATIKLPYDKSIISKRLGIQPETFSRSIKKLNGCGVRIDKKDIIIDDIKELTKFCDFDDKTLSL